MSKTTFEVRIYKKDGPTWLANADVTINGEYVAKNFKVQKNIQKDEIYVTMPTGKPYTDKEGKTQYPEVFHPISADARTELVQAILDAYNAAISEE